MEGNMKTYVLIEVNKGVDDGMFIIKSDNITTEKCFTKYFEDDGILEYKCGYYWFYEVEEIKTDINKF